jgi:hypothetical protein
MNNQLTQAQRIFADTNRWSAAMSKTIALREELDRKFQDMDLATYRWLDLVGEQYARTYEGDFQFMLEQRAALLQGWKLSPRQMAGCLNCAITAWTRGSRKAGEKAQLPNVASVPSSRYRVVQADGSSLAVRLGDAKWATDMPEGTRSLSYLGQGANWIFAGFIDDGAVSLSRGAWNMRNSLKAALDVLVGSVREGDWLVHALAFSREGGQCCFCGKALDTLESIEMGYGPKCAARYNLPWGETSKPASVEAAEATVTAAPAPEVEPEVEAVPAQVEPTTVDQTLAGELAPSQWKGHNDGTFESGRQILRKAGVAPSLDDRYGKSSYRPGRTYEEIFGAD